MIPDVLEPSCATRQALERLAAKWRVLIIYALLAGPQRHAELRRRLPGITQKVLTQTLRGMEDDGLVERRVLKATAPQVVEYDLTALGKTLEAPLAAICEWATRNGASPLAMADDFWIIREAAAEDGEFMAGMLVEAVNWSPAWKPRTRRRVLSAPATRHYIAGWPRATDLGVIAEAGGALIGAAWLRFFAPDDHGYGYVASDVPELTIGVVASWRGRGAGRALMQAVAARAAAAGITRISLSVERKNFARDLYLSEGYQVTDSSDPQADTMVKVLAAG
ncbi:MAG TPA: GNAT family N-acetyltransferase [Trebonia sp.]